MAFHFKIGLIRHGEMRNGKLIANNRDKLTTFIIKYHLKKTIHLS